MGCVYIDTCSTILLCELNTYNFKNLAVGSAIFFFKKLKNAKKNRRSYSQIFKIVCIQLAQQNRQARVNVNATRVKTSSFRKP
jgi:hypothetical protein